ncbi:hypothetical protein QWZ16_21530 [Vibrio ostreicida]|uniref:Uncharacterized protein n=1 Tax=Vibrio ostreicida TaxID=526588 RepID=A0ABT8C0J9_9VIBR|nr:hypothetical protein [Vibrio ostreicida]MDN3612179.1 hypothetical protein [Vibrio ostreicida]
MIKQPKLPEACKYSAKLRLNAGGLSDSKHNNKFENLFEIHDRCRIQPNFTLIMLTGSVTTCI